MFCKSGCRLTTVHKNQQPTEAFFMEWLVWFLVACNFAATNHEQVATLMVESSRIAAAPFQISLSTLTMQALECLVCPFKLPLLV